VESPNSGGLFGALPGSCNVNLLIKNSHLLERFSNGDLPSSSEEFGGEAIDLGAKPGQFNLVPGDIFEYTWQGGGGYGDPLHRDPKLVRDDVSNGAVSRRCGEAIYGTSLKGAHLEVDLDHTKSLRREILKKRLEEAAQPSRKTRSINGRRLMPMGEYLEVVAVDDRFAVRCKCGCDLGDPDNNWKDRTAVLRVDAEVAGPRRRLHEDLEMVEFLCPVCGTLLSVDIKKREDPFLFDAELGGLVR
jgi:N-methylhydantoinase B